MESDAGGGGGISLAAGVFGIRGAKFSCALSRAEPGLTVAVADAAGCTSSCEPIEMKEGASFAREVKVFGEATAGFTSLIAGFVSSGLGAGALGGAGGAQEISRAVFGDSGTAGGRSMGGGATFAAGPGVSDGKAVPQ